MSVQSKTPAQATNQKASVIELANSSFTFASYILPEISKERVIHCPYGVASDAEFFSGMRANPSQAIVTLKDFDRVYGNSQPIFSGICWRNNETKETLPTYALEHPSYKRGLLPTWEGESALVYSLGYTECEKPLRGKPKQFVVDFTFFYSLCDIWYLFRSRDICWGMVSQLVKHRTHKVNPDLGMQHRYLQTGVYFELPVADGSTIICELALNLKDQGGKGQGGLEKVAGSYGLQMPDKHLMNDYKTDMRSAYDNTVDMVKVGDEYMSLHDACVRYGKSDVKILFDLDDKSYDSFANPKDGVIKKLGLSIKPRPFNTVGGITNQMSVMKLAQGLGLIDASSTEISDENKKQLLEYLLPGAFDAINDQGGTAPLLGVLDGGYCKNLQPRLVRWLLKCILDLDLKGCYMEALVHQDYPFGRPIIIKRHTNEKPYLFKTFLEQFEKELVPGLYYMRVSTTVNLTFDQDILISKHFGKLAFEDHDLDQDGNDADDFIMVNGNDGKQKQGVFQLNTRQIATAILTHDSLQALRLASKSEWDELMKVLVVDCASFYPKSQEVSVDQFKRTFKSESMVHHELGSDGTYTRQVLQASRWCRINMGENWCQLFIDFRNINKLMKDTCKFKAKGQSDAAIRTQLLIEHDHMPPQAIEEALLSLANHELDRPKSTSAKAFYESLTLDYDAKQYSFKITGLAIFGTSGSWHYQSQAAQGQNNRTTYNPKSGNFCVANNITARARVGVWAVSKSLLLACVITDGGFFDINRVASWKWEGRNKTRVGLQDLCNLTNSQLDRDTLTRSRQLSITIAPLGGKEWRVQQIKDDRITISNGTTVIEGRKEKWKVLDQIAFDHVKTQFPMLDVFSKNQFKFASKQLYQNACIQSQANYYLVPFEGLLTDQGKPDKPALASRGYKVNRSVFLDPTCSEQEIKQHPYYKQMLSIYEGTQVTHVERAYTSELTGVNDVNSSEKSLASYRERDILPNEPTPSSSFPRPISLSMFRWQTFDQYSSWNKHHDRLRINTGWGIEGYFPFAQITDEFKSKDGKFTGKVMLSIDYDRAVVAIQDAIDKGWMWIDGSNPSKGVRGRCKPEHGMLHPQLIDDYIRFPRHTDN